MQPISSNVSDSSQLVRAQIGNRKATFLIDTGARASLIKPEWIDFRIGRISKDHRLELVGITGDVVPVQGSCNFQLYLGTKVINHQFWICGSAL